MWSNPSSLFATRSRLILLLGLALLVALVQAKEKLPSSGLSSVGQLSLDQIDHKLRVRSLDW